MRNILGGAAMAVLAAVFMVGQAGQPAAKAQDPAWIDEMIQADGQALFYAVSGAARTPLWQVHCPQPLRGCVARAAGLVLRLDAQGRPWLLGAAGHGARVSIQTRNYTQDHPALFLTPLDTSAQSRLSARDSFIVIESAGQVILRSRTSGLDHVLSYLAWVNSGAARTLRDARLWPKDGALDVADMTPEVLERYEVMQRRRTEKPRQLVPATKPQIEFAMRAQGGSSYYSPTGQAGY